MAHSLPIAGTGGSVPPAAVPVDRVLAGVAPRVEGAYVHVPFCFHKCHYCDFYSFEIGRAHV